jgi:hypothetical protein
MSYVRLGLIILSSFIALMAVLAIPPRPAYACSCVPPPPPQVDREQATAVFAGTVSALGGSSPLNEGDIMVTFELQEVWKGPEGPQLTLVTASNSAACGYAFTQGESYLVYADVQGNQLRTNLCTRTTLLALANSDLEALGPGTPVAADQSGASSVTMDIPWLPIILIGIVLLVGLAFFGPTLLRRRR